MVPKINRSSRAVKGISLQFNTDPRSQLGNFSYKLRMLPTPNGLNYLMSICILQFDLFQVKLLLQYDSFINIHGTCQRHYPFRLTSGSGWTKICDPTSGNIKKVTRQTLVGFLCIKLASLLYYYIADFWSDTQTCESQTSDPKHVLCISIAIVWIICWTFYSRLMTAMNLKHSIHV